MADVWLTVGHNLPCAIDNSLWLTMENYFSRMQFFICNIFGLVGFRVTKFIFLFLGDQKLWSSKKVKTQFYLMFSTGLTDKIYAVL